MVEPKSNQLTNDFQIEDLDYDTLAGLYDQAMQDFTEGSIIKGRILEIHPNEVLVDIGYKSEGVVPASEFEDLSALQPDQEIDVLLERLEDEDGMVIVSFQKAEQKKNWERILNLCEEGATVPGKIKAKVKGGLIVDIGVEAFLPGSQVDISPVRNLDPLIGEEYDFKVIKINYDRRNIVLSRRELLEEERREKRAQLLAKIEPGLVCTGIVKNITDFGAFVDLDGLDGLLHITDMSWGRINHPGQMVSVGQEIEVMILEVNRERERVSLGLKQRQRNPWEDVEDRYPIGSRIRGRVVNLMPYGAFVEIEEGIEGLVHVSELSWTKRVNKASEVLKEGDVVDAVVLGIQKKEQRISLGIRQTQPNPWDLVAEKYPIGSRVSGSVQNLTSYGAFVELEEGIDGMIHVSDMSWTRKVNHPSEIVKKGEEVEAMVLEINPEQQRISLGFKQLQTDPWVNIEHRYRVNDVVHGKVTKLTSFGAFVELEDGIDGLVHISQISSDRVERIKDVLQVGEEVEARVVKIDPDERRIGLSIKAVEQVEEEIPTYEEVAETLRRGEDIVTMHDAFDRAFQGITFEEAEKGKAGSGGAQGKVEEFEPGASRKEAAAAVEPEAVEPVAVEPEAVEPVAPEASDEVAEEASEEPSPETTEESSDEASEDETKE